MGQGSQLKGRFESRVMLNNVVLNICLVLEVELGLLAIFISRFFC